MFRLRLLNPPPGAAALVPLEGEAVRVGRDPSAQVVLDSPAVSRQHAVFHQEAGGWWVEDLGGSNGTQLNGQRIDKAWLKPGDRLRFGQIEVVFEGGFPGAGPSSPPPLPSRSVPPPLPPHLPVPAAPPPLPTAKPKPHAPAKSPVGLWLVLAACVLLLLGGGAWFLKNRLGRAGKAPDLLAFREAAGKDPREAFGQALAAAQVTQLADLNQVLWPTVAPEVGWTYFFRTCLVTTGPAKGGRQAVLFYHPWSDTALLTEWKDQKELLDLEMLPGAALRRNGAPPYGGTLGWTRLQAYAPPAVGLVTAQTLKAFEKAFAAETDLASALPWLAKPQAREACRVASSLQFAQMVKSLVTFSAAFDQPARLAFIRLLALGKDAPAHAPQTPADSATALRNLPQQAWSGFQPTALVDTDTRVLVMAHHRDSPDLFLGVVFRREGAELVAERMDLLSFNACYGALK